MTVRSGIRTHAYISRLRPERSALDHSTILTCDIASFKIAQMTKINIKLFEVIYVYKVLRNKGFILLK